MKFTDEQIKQCELDHDLSYFRAQVCVENPESFTLEEKQQIVQDMNLSDMAIDEIIRQDFQAMTKEEQDFMYGLLTADKPELKEYWDSILFV